MDLILTLRLGYLSAAASVLTVYLTPPLRARFLAYGPRASTPISSSSAEREKRAAQERPDLAPYTTLLNRVAELRVPHSWFTSFYAVSVTCSLFWASQVLFQGPLFRVVAGCTSEGSASMTFQQVLTTWALMLVQGSRRLYECLEFSRPSNSQMWVGHWVLGIGFYMTTSLALWIEGIPAIQNHTLSITDLAITAPTLRSFLSIIFFLLASGFQHDCHAYLASLKTTKPNPTANSAQQAQTDGYTLPTHPAFANLIAPHYTAECLIYLSLAILAAPQGSWMNWTLVCGMVFVGVNLGVTAEGTREWYLRRFGVEGVRGRWRMVPFIF